MSKRRPPPIEEPGKPLSEMTAEERHAYVAELRRRTRAELRELDRPARERQLRRGRAKPRNRAGIEIFVKDLLGQERDE